MCLPFGFRDEGEGFYDFMNAFKYWIVNKTWQTFKVLPHADIKQIDYKRTQSIVLMAIGLFLVDCVATFSGLRRRFGGSVEGIEC